jgi:hypothetical protein
VILGLFGKTWREKRAVIDAEEASQEIEYLRAKVRELEEAQSASRAPLTREELGLPPVGTTYTFEAYANPEEGDEVYVSIPPALSHLLGERLRVSVTILPQPGEIP